jgi:hypothetical protein
MIYCKRFKNPYRVRPTEASRGVTVSPIVKPGETTTDMIFEPLYSSDGGINSSASGSGATGACLSGEERRALKIRCRCRATTIARRDRYPSLVKVEHFFAGAREVGEKDGIAAAYAGFTTLTIRMSRSEGARRRLGKMRVVRRNDASVGRRRCSSASTSEIDDEAVAIGAESTCGYSCVITRASTRCDSAGELPSRLGLGWISCLQKFLMEAGESKSHSSAYISSLLDVCRRTGMSSWTRGLESDDVNAMTCAPRSASSVNTRRPTAVKAPW